MPEGSALNIPSSPIAAVGTICLLVAFVLAAYATAVGVLGSSRGNRRLIQSSMYGLWAFTGLMMVASALMIYAFLTHDYSIKYVAHYSDSTMPVWYKLTAYWGGLDGSMMFWVAVLSGFGAVAVYMNRDRHRDMMGYVVATLLIVSMFFLAVIIYAKNPFATFLTEAPPDGRGLNPLLQNYWMVIHPPSLYVGFVAATVPFAFCIGALASGRLDDNWIYSIRVWLMICWFFLSLGLILGGRWAYEELGWGGYWAWDPVENAGLLPWFTATAVLHSIIIQEQRATMKVWNVVLIIFTFFLTIWGTFMTRTGIVQSVHAFGEDKQLALLFILFMAAIFIIGFGMLFHRLPMLQSRGKFDSFMSREVAFLVNNWMLLGCTVFVLFATMFPTLSEAFKGQRITVGPPFFNRFMVPTGIVLVFLAGAAPLLAWRRTATDRLLHQFAFPAIVGLLVPIALAIFVPRSRAESAIFTKGFTMPIALVNFGVVAFTLAACLQEFWKGLRVRRKQTGGDPLSSLVGLVLAKRRRYGGYVIHMGIAVMFIGFAGKAYDLEKDFTFARPGEKSAQPIRGYEFSYTDFTKEDHGTYVEWMAHVEVSFRGEHLGTVTPAKREYPKSMDEQLTTEPDMLLHGMDDVYLALLGFDERAKIANFRLFINPLINWVWAGFVLLMIGTAICLVPEAAVQRTKKAPTTRAGKAADVAVVLLFVLGSAFATVRAAQADVSVPRPVLEQPVGDGDGR